MGAEVAGLACGLCGALDFTMTVAGEPYCFSCLDSPTGHALRHLVEGVDMGCEQCLAMAVRE